MEKTQNIKTIGIVGGGKVGLHLYELFGSSKFSKVAFITISTPALRLWLKPKSTIFQH